jgi:hypothetical protein
MEILKLEKEQEQEPKLEIKTTHSLNKLLLMMSLKRLKEEDLKNKQNRILEKREVLLMNQCLNQ